MTSDPPFGAWLKHRRKALGLTQPQLGARVGCAGETIRKIEAGRLRPSEHVAERLAEQLAIPVGERAAFVRRLRTTAGASGEQLPFRAVFSSTATPHAASSLPTPLTPLIGRARELACVAQAVTRDAVRLLTLVGPPGIGKTRLALQVARDVAGQFADGVVLVELAPISDPALVIGTIEQSVATLSGADRSPLDRLIEALRDKQLLLVLDNFEQVLAAAATVSTLLERAPGLKVLATSRIPLQVYGEHEYGVPPLAVPDTDMASSRAGPAQVHEYAAIRLFVERAQAVRSDFALTVENAPAVVALCRRLDGVPLAIELAAARMKMFTPEGLSGRFHYALDAVTKGPQNVPPRQQTLRGAIAWSYDLLPSIVQTLFNRLGVFVGGFTIEALTAL